MKTKKKTYVLLVLVLGVWGTFAYKLISGLNPDLPEFGNQQVMAVKDFRVNAKIDTFSVTITSRDPFLGIVTKKKPSDIPKKKRSVISWKPVEYLGTVKGSEKGQQVFIVTINAQQYLLKKGQTRDSIRLVSGDKNRVVLRYKNKQKTIARKNQ